MPGQSLHDYEARMVPSGPDEVTAIVRDITERKKSETALHQTMERLRIQHEIDTAILAAQSPQEIMRATLERIHHLVPSRQASISEIDSQQELARETMILNPNGIQTAPANWHPTSDAGPDLFTAMHQGRPYVIQDIAAQGSPTPLERAIATAGLRAYISVPLTGPDGPIGTLNLGSERPNFFQPDHVEILEEIAASLSVALQQAHLLEQARQDAETKAMLLREVNHRVKNNLDAIIGLLYIERRHASPEAMIAYQPIMHDLTNRIVSLARVHDMLSATGWTPLQLDELAEKIVGSIAQTTPHKTDVAVTSSDIVWITPDQAHHLALILSELATNTSKYAAQKGKTVHITLGISRHHDMITLTYRNDGPDYPDEVLRLERHSIGLDIIQQVVKRNLEGTMTLRNDNGAVTEIVFRQIVST
jgi:two-component sensor histidine kinase